MRFFVRAVAIPCALVLASCGQDLQEQHAQADSADAESADGALSFAEAYQSHAQLQQAAEAAPILIRPKQSSGMCLDVAGGRNVNSQPVQLAKCNGSEAQKWRRVNNMLQVFGDKCLTVVYNKDLDGTRLQIYTCNKDDPTHKWSPSGGTLRWKGNLKKCLDVTGGSYKDGNPMQIWTCDAKAANKNQWFGFSAASASPTPASPAPTSPAKPASPAAPAAPNNSSSGVFGPSPAGLDVAPYFAQWAQWGNSPAKKLVDTRNKMGLKGATIAFALSGGGCKVTGFGEDGFGDDIKAFRNAGGRVILSFGGQAGTYLHKTCQDKTQLADAIAGQMNTYNTRAIDFDIEGHNLDDTSANNALLAALVLLQNKYSDLHVSFTLPVDNDSGMPGTVMTLLRNAAHVGLRVGRVNIMAMDYGKYPKNGQSVGDMAISATEKTAAQMQSIWPKASKNEIYHAIGITPMIGQNDIPENFFFSLDDAKKVASYAKSHNIGLLSYWMLQRDRAGKGGLDDHSNSNNNDFDFYKIFAGAQ